MSRHFRLETDPMLACTCKHENCNKRMVNPVVLNQLDLIRDDLGAPMVITSGGRCGNHPNERSKSKPGDHQMCMAVDVKCNDASHETKLKVLAGRHGATRVAGGAYCGFIHMAWTKTDRKDIPTWEY